MVIALLKENGLFLDNGLSVGIEFRRFSLALSLGSLGLLRLVAFSPFFDALLLVLGGCIDPRHDRAD